MLKLCHMWYVSLVQAMSQMHVTDADLVLFPWAEQIEVLFSHFLLPGFCPSHPSHLKACSEASGDSDGMKLRNGVGQLQVRLMWKFVQLVKSNGMMSCLYKLCQSKNPSVHLYDFLLLCT